MRKEENNARLTHPLLLTTEEELVQDKEKRHSKHTWK